jgi:predicted negative regulator of RcsB-dependent stress response
MAYNFEEQEQLEDLKAWWNKYGGFLLTVLVVISVSVAGWRLWGWYQDREAARAAVAISVLRDALREEDLSKVRAASATLFSEHAGTIYAPMGSLLAAKAYAEAGDLAAAGEALRWTVENAPESEFAPLARLRLSAVLLDDGKAQEALEALEAAQVPKAFAGAFADRRGDVLVVLERIDDARKAYTEALAVLDQGSPLRSQVTFKLDALGAGA